jgi:hypothetical protein
VTGLFHPSRDRIVGKTCWRCSTEFSCGPQGGDENCWCDGRPAVKPRHEGADCLCPACLDNEVADQQPAPLGSANAERSFRDNEAARVSLVEGKDYYRDGSAIVFTAAYHLRRGACCGSGCRHCPYR